MTSLEILKERIGELMPYLVSKYDIDRIYIFGSYATQRQNDASDIDLLVDFRKTPDLLTFIEMEEYLSEQLHKKVDLVPKRKLKPRLKERILKEAVAV